ncbi:hypothetical protein MML48_8g00012285 [Holotrichia oblita]|uniref:Uncharacterized protein n=1 Tax=Holotrichia oblita TaxID=644536 RepID=A0ACB9SRK4_HOLOL|nr:hypothetical protein MML48_8g00012285 [Holotrichia oblita]
MEKEDISGNELLESEESDQEMDNCECSNHNSNSEQDISSDDDQAEEETEESNHFYLGKDKSTRWKKEKPPANVRTRSHNLLTELPGTKGTAKNVKTELESLELYLDSNIVRIVTKCTNIYITKIKEKYTRERDARLTDEIEIRALIGLLYYIGILRYSRQNILQL